MAQNNIGENITLPIYNANGTSFHNLALHKFAYESVVMSLGDKISGDVYYKDNKLVVANTEYVEYGGVKFYLVNPPTIVKEGTVSGNSQLKGMTKYSFVFYHPMYMLSNMPFTDVAVSSDEAKYKSQDKTFFWIGNLVDYVGKINKNLQGTKWVCEVGDTVPVEERTKLSEVLPFDKQSIADALKTGYDTWEVPYIVDTIASSDSRYSEGKRFLVRFGLPSQEILVNNNPYVFRCGQGVGLKNNSRTPRNNKIITRIAGYGSETNVPFGYPQIPWEGDQTWDYTINNDSTNPNSYPIYDGIVGGQSVRLIKHPFTRSHLMPSIYMETLNRKVNPYATGYDPTTEIKDYYDAVNDSEWQFPNQIVNGAPSYDIHEFEKIKPELGDESIISATPYDENVANYITKSDFASMLSGYYSGSDNEDEKEQLRIIESIFQTVTQRSEQSSGNADYQYEWSITSDSYFAFIVYNSSILNFSYTVLRASNPPSVAWDDTMDDDGNYVQGYFKIKLPILDFDIYASAAVTQEMTINMRSGACIGCSFPVQVDWEDYKRNFYTEDGDFAPNGSQRDLNKYPNSSTTQVELLVQKDIQTFGTLMPNIYQKPATGDKFVVLGISLPTEYITDAEERLDNDMKQYMLDNNVHYFDYPLNFDEYFLATHTGILSQMKGNVIVRFDFADNVYALYIKQIAIKYGENPLPKYDITLTDDVEIVLNQIGKVTDDVSKLRVLFGQGAGDANYSAGKSIYLSKVRDDVANGLITHLKGLQVGERFTTGLLGEGGVFRREADGTTYIEADKLYIRMRAYFDTVEVKKFLHSGGNRTASKGGGITCSRVEYIDSSGNVVTNPSDAVLFRCYFKATDNDKTIRNDFVVGDQAFCKETNVNVSEVNQHGYWRLVVGRNSNGTFTDGNEAWIDLSNRSTETLVINGTSYTHAGYLSGSDAPIAQDDIVHLGNIHDVERQGAIVEYVGGADAPSYQIYQGISDFTLVGKNFVSLGYSTQTGRAYLNVYGDMYLGDPLGSSYIQYNASSKRLDIKAAINIDSPVVDGQTQTTFANIFSGLQAQIDGNINTWFYAEPPYPSVDNDDDPNLPYTDWDTDAKKINHEGDLYYDTLTGHGYRFGYNTDTEEYEWFRITDEDVTEALRLAYQAKQTADAAELHASSFDYIANALNASTDVYGGLMLTSLIGLRQRNQDDTYTIWSGINGVYNASKYGGGVAAWFGGALGDYEHQDQYSDVTRHPKTLFRMDGSGYVANGAISWDATGLTNVTASSISALTMNLGGKAVATQEWVGLNYISIAYFDRLFRAYNGSTLVQHNDITSTIDNIKAMFGFWTAQYLSALGNSSGQVVSLGLSELLDVQLSTPVSNGQALVYNSTILKWENQTISTVTALANLTDVLLSSPADGQTLLYDGTNAKWYNSALKTINGQSLLGSGDISVGGGASGNYLPLSGGTLVGKLTVDVNISNWISEFLTGNTGVWLAHGGGYGVAIETTTTSTNYLLQIMYGQSTLGRGGNIALKVLANGNVGIRTDPSQNLHINGDVQIDNGMIYLSKGRGGYFVADTVGCYIQSGNTNWVYVKSSDGIELHGDTNASGRLYATGALRASGSSGIYVGADYLGDESRGYDCIERAGSGNAMHLHYFNSGNVSICKGGGRVGIGLASPSYKLHVDGTIYATGSVTALSDIRQKNINEYMQLGIDEVANAPIIKFTWKKQTADNKGLHVGSIAQYWEKVLPEAVKRDKEGTLSMSYGVVALVAAVSTAKKVQEHERRIADLERENKELKERLKIA